MKKTDRLAESYRILGVREGITLPELKRVFHKKALLYHPDCNPSPAAAAEFKNITHAYDVLKAHLRRKPRLTSAPPRPRPGSARPWRELDLQASESSKKLSVDELIFRLENSENKYVRLHAVRALASHEGRDVLWHIIKSLNDPETEVHRAAAAALGRLGARVAVLPLIRRHRTASPETAASIRTALRQIDSPLAQKFLMSHANPVPAPEPAPVFHKSSDIA